MKPARHYEQVVRRLDQLMAAPQAQVDPSWHAALLSDLGDVAEAADLHLMLPDVERLGFGTRLGLAVFQQVCGEAPDVTDLDELPGRWCLLAREDRLARLAALALAATPGALRSCVRRGPRQALEAVLGPAYGPLVDLGAGATAAPPEVAERPPAEWALEAYQALRRAGHWRDRALRRWVRLGLPRTVASAGALPALRTDGRVLAPGPVNAHGSERAWASRPSRAAAQTFVSHLPMVDAWFQT
ncbi:type III secretion protein [Roseateles sp. SL47]|uniref:type III secretion protein HrpB4 n=1 Tax=Roseateles sp. SL47 TaxID=2995138 RepID=UPI00226D92D8|nr:type III secretion protein HrpB4 [Roseateles sp. SL47]WAC71589.1 type III secretion protein [Roseateles sp. SL47]